MERRILGVSIPSLGVIPFLCISSLGSYPFSAFLCHSATGDLCPVEHLGPRWWLDSFVSSKPLAQNWVKSVGLVWGTEIACKSVLSGQLCCHFPDLFLSYLQRVPNTHKSGVAVLALARTRAVLYMSSYSSNSIDTDSSTIARRSARWNTVKALRSIAVFD